MTGKSSCKNCTAGTFFNGTGAKSPTECIPCGYGKHNPDSGSSSPSACVACRSGLEPIKNLGSAICVEAPTSSPTSAPSGEPTTIPTGQPSRQPTSSPTGQPTTNPTMNRGSTQSWTLSTLLSEEDLKSGNGLYYVGQRTFTNLGHFYERYFLSLFVYDTGFGPVGNGEYVTFLVNGKVLRDTAGKEIMCAPVFETKHINTSESNAGVGIRKGCTGLFFPCAFNIDITQQIRSVGGGSVDVAIKSFGVISSACPYLADAENHPENKAVVRAKFVVSAVPQDTPHPTFAPSPTPTKSNLNIYEGLQLDINSLDVWALLQICLAVGATLGMFAAFLTNIRKKAEKTVYQHPMVSAIVSCALLATEFTSMVFMMVRLEWYGFNIEAIVLGVFRIVHFVAGLIVVLGLFGPVKLRQRSGFMTLVDHDHLTSESRIYMAVAALCLIDTGYVAFLPWRDSRFATLSKGLPCLRVWASVYAVTMLSVVVSLSCQIPFLIETAPTSSDRLIFIFNIVLLCIKSLFVIGEFYFKYTVLAASTTTTAEGDVELGSRPREQASEEEIVYEENPLHAQKNDEKESEPLLTLLTRVENLELHTKQMQRAIDASLVQELSHQSENAQLQHQHESEKVGETL